LGDKEVRQLILWGQTIDAAAAKTLGLVQAVVAPGKLMETTMEWAVKACDGAPGAVAREKRLLNDLSGRALHADIARALRDHLLSRNSAEAGEGIAAFLARRKPVWPPRAGT
jgi:enoyl-CoA hydratase/carnithine racemase